MEQNKSVSASYRPEAPGRIPPQTDVEVSRYGVEPARSTRTAPEHAKRAEQSPGPQTMASDRLIGIFGTRRKVAAGIADETGKGQLIQAYQPCSEEASWSFRPSATPISRVSDCSLGFAVNAIVAH